MRPVASRWTAILAFAVLLSVSWGQSPGARDHLLHHPAPQFVRTDLNGQRVDLASYKGRVVLLTFWATWCAPCRIEMPHFIEWQKQYRPDEFQIIAISMDDDEEPVRALMLKQGLNYPVVMGDEELGTAYGGVLGLPVTFLIDRDGNVAAKFQGEGTLDAMRRAMLHLLKSR